ncbi:MAG: phosphonate C-P lyase system protein PhnH [Micrococcales bacterium]|nr:phosphonate C-P lyase system protein PhnH [Micrococcales bacterium]
MSSQTDLEQPVTGFAADSEAVGTTVRIPAPGFTDRVHGAQQTFRALLDACGRPTTTVTLPCEVSAPGLLTRSAAAFLLTLADDSSPLWLDSTLASDPDVTAWIEFHTGAPLVADRSSAAFALVAAPERLPTLDSFALGSDEAPHTSTTVVVMTDPELDRTVDGLWGVDGPGFPEPAIWDAPALPVDFAAQWARNGALFPRGVDLVLASDDAFVALPRTTRLTTVDQMVEVA